MTRLTVDQYEFIKGEVVALFERYNIRCIPISGFEIAYKMKIKLIPYSSLTEGKFAAAMEVSHDGFLVETMDGSNIIYYNDKLSNEHTYERINMTILHEIGHCVLDHTGESEMEELEAKFFAKYAAAPPPLVHQIHPKRPEDIEYAFCLSHEAAVYAIDYYYKWLMYGKDGSSRYEARLLRLFQIA